MSRDKQLVIASRNRHKVHEVQQLLADDGWRVVAVDDVADLPDVVEDGDTFVANAIKKAQVTAEALGCLVLADDSGLEVDALQGAPGVYSARFAGEPSSDQRNNEKLLQSLADVSETKRGAQFRCVIAIADHRGLVETCDGVVRGIITNSPRGEHGFGYDPLFLVPEYEQTFAQLGDEIKNKISHRSVAMQKAKNILSNYE